MAGQKVGGITIELGGDASGLAKAIKEINSHVSKLQTQLSNVDKLLKLDPKNTELLRQKQTLLAKEIEATKVKLHELNEAYNVLKSQDGFNKNSEKAMALRREIENCKISLKAMNDELSHTKVVGEVLVAVGDEISDVGEEVEGIAKKIAPVTAAATAVLGAGAKEFGSFEYEMSKTAAAMGKNLEDIPEIVERARELGETTKFTAQEAASAFTILARSGYDVNQQLQMSEKILDLAAAGDMELADAATYLTTVFNGFNSEVEVADDGTGEYVDIITKMADITPETSAAMQKYTDIMAKGATLANTSTAQLGEGLGRVSATASAFGQDVEGTTVALLRLAKGNMQGSDAATALRQILVRLYAPTNKAKKSLDALGVSAFDSAGKARDVNVVVTELKDAMMNLSDSERDAELHTILGSRAMMAFSAMAMTGSEDVTNFYNQLSSSSGSAAQQAETMLNTLQGRFTILKSQISELLISIGEQAMPIIDSIIAGIGNVVTWLNNLDEEQKNTIVSILEIVAAVGALLLVGGNVIKGIGSLTSTIGMFINAGPVAWIIAAVAALAVLVATHWDEIKAIIDKAVSWVTTAFHDVIDWIKQAWEDVGNFFSELFNKIADWLKSWALDFMKPFLEIYESITGLFDGITNFIEGAFSGNWKQAWEGIVQIFKGIWNTVVDILKAPLNLGITLINKFIKGINGIIGTINLIPGVNVGPIGQIPLLAKGGILSKGSAIVGEAGPELLTVNKGRAMVQPLSSTTNNNNLGGMTVNIYAQPGQDVQELAHMVSQEIAEQYQSKKAVFA